MPMTSLHEDINKLHKFVFFAAWWQHTLSYIDSLFFEGGGGDYDDVDFFLIFYLLIFFVFVSLFSFFTSSSSSSSRSTERENMHQVSTLLLSSRPCPKMAVVQVFGRATIFNYLFFLAYLSRVPSWKVLPPPLP